MKNIMNRKVCTSQFIIRLFIGTIFLAHGIAKFNVGIDGVSDFFGSLSIPLPTFFAWVVTLLETFGGLFIILGVFVRKSAMFLIFTMLVAIFTAKKGLPLVGGYELELALIAGLIPLLVHGAGRYSIKKFFKKKEVENTPIPQY